MRQKCSSTAQTQSCDSHFNCILCDVSISDVSPEIHNENRWDKTHPWDISEGESTCTVYYFPIY